MNLKDLFNSLTQTTVNTIDIKFIKQELAILEKFLGTSSMVIPEIICPELTDEEINRICI